MEALYSRLEAQLRALVQQCETLRHDNEQLRQREALLKREKDALLARQQRAIAQIETMVSRLKSVERQS
jgi:uncharacterized protein (TIGR02449 family)